VPWFGLSVVFTQKKHNLRIAHGVEFAWSFDPHTLLNCNVSRKSPLFFTASTKAGPPNH